MAEIIGIRFKREGKQYFFDPQGIQVAPGEGVILETSWGIEFGTCVRGNTEVSEGELVAPLRPIVRLATAADYETLARNQKRERDAMALCQRKIEEHGLDMKLVDVEYSFEGTKILFFFTSEGRVDFRNLVKDLAAAFHTRIELRQIGVRDEAKMLGGLGICGRPFCCASFLREFQPVSIKMAKTQSLSLNPTKISGTCGRLMCCLKYEQHAYEDLLKTSPRADSFVETPDGVGDIINVHTLREKVRVRLDSEPDSLKTYHNSEIRVVRPGKGKRPEGYVPPPPEQLKKLRRAEEAGEEAPEKDALRRFLDEMPAAAPPPDRAEERRSRRRSQPERQERPAPDKRRDNRRPPEPRQAEAIPTEAPKQEPAAPDGKKPHKRPARRGGKASQGAQKPAEKPQAAPAQAAPPADKPPDKGGEKKPRNYWRRRPRGGGKKDGGSTSQS